MPKILVSPVAFNEHTKLKNAIVRFLAARDKNHLPIDYLIVDDGSTDGTTSMIESFKNQGVKTIRHPERSGVGAAIRTAIKYARAQQYDVLVIMAGNDKDNPQEISRLLDPISEENYDLVQGSRYLAGGGFGGDMPLYRKF
ncbi:MAG TPA: glycosyltransferase family 2 protein, partial [Candidatus Omnitrophota bacterium]|nr:glycosyltransferase family 2 protein [Candidatus Omnitrophota bacterium]